MANFQKLSEVNVIEEVKDTSMVLVEENGEIYRAPKTSVGGAGGIKTAIIRDSGYLNAIAGLQVMASMPSYTYECINMTFEEAYETMAKGEPLDVIGMLTSEGCANMHGTLVFLGIAAFGVPCIVVLFSGTELFWTADGLSTETPSSDK